MSHSPPDTDTESDADTDAETDTHTGSDTNTDTNAPTRNSPVASSRHFEDPLQQVHHDITSQLATVDRDGEQLKQLVGYAIIGNRADSTTTQHLQQQLAELLAELHDSTDDVSLDDIAIALWAELTRVSQMALSDSDHPEDEPSSNTDTDTSNDEQAQHNTQTEPLENLSDTEDTETPDRMFQ